MQHFLWFLALVVTGLSAAALTHWVASRQRRSNAAPLPSDWAITARPVFTTDERRVYRLLREALPHHVILSKLPLVRFCQPADTRETRYWYELLGSIHVSFAVCSANGRVLAAIDLSTERGNSQRVVQIKQSVLAACRVRYSRSSNAQLPSVAELQLLVPQAGAVGAQPSAPAPTPVSAQHQLDQARDTLATTVASRRAERSARWQDSSVFQDSFFAPDSRLDGFSSSNFGGLYSLAAAVRSDEGDSDEVSARPLAQRSRSHGEDGADLAVVEPRVHFDKLRSH